MPDYYKVLTTPPNQVAYGSLLAASKIDDRGITFEAGVGSIADLVGAAVDVAIPNNTRKLLVRTDAAAGEATIYVDGDESSGVGIPINGAGLVNEIDLDFASLDPNAEFTVTIAALSAASYIQFTAFGRVD